MTKEQRSRAMSNISCNETQPEITVRKFLFSKGLRFRKNDKRYPGKPDILLPKYKTAIFVHGCFWHGHNCPAGKLPETRKDFWKKKINDTKTRDKRNINELKDLGWKVIIVWECEIKSQKVKEIRFKELINEIIKTN